MNSLTIGLISAACIFGGAVLGLVLRSLLPDHHLRDESKDTIKVGAGMVATLSALVLGLLVGSAKSSFDTMQAEITQGGAKLIVLDRVLAGYGPEAKPVRDQLRRNVVVGIETIWSEENTGEARSTAFERANGMDLLQARMRELQPATDAQRQALAEAAQIFGDLRQARWLVIEQAQSAIPTPFLVVLLFWLTILHMSFGLFAPRNATVIIVLLLCALSMSGALFLILEMNHPLDGMIKVSSAPMRKALEHLGK